MTLDVIKENKLTTASDECIDINGDDIEKYHKFSISKKTLKARKDIQHIPFNILVKKGNQGIYTKQGDEIDKSHSIG